MQLVKHSVRLVLLTLCVGAATAGYAADTKQKDAAEAKNTAAKPDAKQKNVAIVNGIGIPKSRLDFVAKSQLAQAQQQQQQQQGQGQGQGQPGQPQMQDTPEFRNNLREILITREILYQEAVKRKLDKTVDYQTQVDLAKQQIILAALVDDLSKKLTPTDADIRKEYERVKAERSGEAGKQYKSRHILVKDEAAAKQIIADLEAGGDFAAIAKEKSEDTGSKEDGGELDWAEAQSYVQPFGEALQKLNKGERTKEPVKTNYGYHIIELEDVKTLPFPPLDEVKTQIQQQLATKVRDDYIAELRTKAKVQKLETK